MGLWGRVFGRIREVFTGEPYVEDDTSPDEPDYGSGDDEGDSDLLPTSSDYDFIAVGWKDFADNTYREPPDASNLDSTYGVLVQAVNKENPEDQHWFWAFSVGGFDTWDEWYAYIDSLIDAYASTQWAA